MLARPDVSVFVATELHLRRTLRTKTAAVTDASMNVQNGYCLHQLVSLEGDHHSHVEEKNTGNNWVTKLCNDRKFLVTCARAN